jgi:hypothetical protein
MMSDKQVPAIVAAPAVALARPSFVKTGDRRGTEGITKDDLSIPRIGLAQALTPQVVEGADGFKPGVLFNSVTKTLLGKDGLGPIEFVIVRRDQARYIEFFPRDAGGGIKDTDIKSGDPRTKFTNDPETKKRLKPVATKFYDFLVMMYPLTGNPFDSIIGLSFKSSGLADATQLNMRIVERDAPLFAGKYRLTTELRRKNNFAWHAFKVENAGWVTDEGEYQMLEKLYDSLADKKVVIDRAEDDTPDDTDFNYGANNPNDPE